MMLQIALCFLIQLGEPLALTLSSPFIVQLIHSTGITGGDEKLLGYYVGLVESSIFVGEGLSVYAWARLSDRIGRKPVLLIGQLILALATLHLGLSSSYWQVLCSRGSQGLANGNIGVIKTVMAEISTPSSAAHVFSMIPVAFVVGACLGPIFGGTLAHPPFLEKWPYLFPCAFVACITCFIAFLVHLRFKETLNSITEDVDTITGKQPLLPEQPKHVADSILTSRGVILTIASSALTAFTSQAIICLLPLFYATSTKLGGLGLTPYQIGVLLGVAGAVKAILQLILFPPAIARWGPRKVYIGCIFLFTLAPISTALISLGPKLNAVLYSLMAIQLLALDANSVAFGSLYVYFTLLVPRSSIASLNGIVQMVGTVNKALAPAIVTSLYSYSLQGDSRLVYWFLLGATCLNVLSAISIPKISRV